MFVCIATASELSCTHSVGAVRRRKTQLFINIKAWLTNQHRQRVRTAANAPFTHDIPVKRPCSAHERERKKNPARLRTFGLLCNIRGRGRSAICSLTYISPPARWRSRRCQRWTSSWAVAVLVAEAVFPLSLPSESTPGVCRRNATEAGASLGRCAPSVRRWCGGQLC